jgi:hypothetical protein
MVDENFPALKWFRFIWAGRYPMWRERTQFFAPDVMRLGCFSSQATVPNQIRDQGLGLYPGE